MRRKNKAFTLMELLLVVAIIGILVAMMVPNLAGRSEEARIARAQSEINSTIKLALSMFESHTGKFPTTEQGLTALVTDPGQGTSWRGPYIERVKQLKDPWGNEYHYECPGQNNTTSYDLASAGPDGQLGTEDDVTNYDGGQESTSY